MGGMPQTAGAQTPPPQPQPEQSAPPTPTPDELFARNSAYAQPPGPNGYMTQLHPNDEVRFQDWVKQSKAPFDPSPKADYDLRGFWRALQVGDPVARSAVNANDGKVHLTDHFKTPYHESFSRESQWATSAAPTWNEKDQLVLPNGEIVFDEPAVTRARQEQEQK